MRTLGQDQGSLALEEGCRLGSHDLFVLQRMRPVYAISAFLLVAGLAPIQAEEHPSWRELQQLFGQRLETKEFKEFMKRNDLLSGYWNGIKELGPWIFPRDRGFEIKHRSIRAWACVTSIELRVADWPNSKYHKDRKPYSAKLPFGLEPGFQRADIEAKLGKGRQIDPKSYAPYDKEEAYAWRVNNLEFIAWFERKAGRFTTLHVTDLEVKRNSAVKK